MPEETLVILDERTLREAPPTRERMLAFLLERPGATRAEAAAALALSYHTADYHLDRLVTAGKASAWGYGAETHYFPAGMGLSRVARAEAAVLRRDGATRVLSLARERPGASVAEMARALDVATTTIAWHVRRLTEQGLLPASTTAPQATPRTERSMGRDHPRDDARSAGPPR